MPIQSDLELARLLLNTGAVSAGSAGQFVVKQNRIPRALIAYLANNGMLVDGEIAPHGQIAIEMLRAEDDVRRLWQARGGPASMLGISSGNDITVRSEGSDWVADFRSGKIVVKPLVLQTLEQRIMHVDFVGIECVGRQESIDEIYGVVGAIIPSLDSTEPRHTKTHAFPGGDATLKMGPDGHRIRAFNVPLYIGAVADVVLVCALVEHDDFADVDGAAKKIAEKIHETAANIFGTLTGLPAEAVSDQTWFKDTLAAALGFVMGDLLGMGDDPYPGQVLKVGWHEMGEFGPPRQLPRIRTDDPMPIPNWTHAVKLAGTDDGGDYGEYHLFFNIWIEPVTVVREDGRLAA